MALIAEVACGAAKGAQTVVMLTTSSGTALARHLARAGLPPDTRTEHLLARHDPQAQGVLDAWAGPLRQAIDSLITLCNPQLVVIGGGAGRGQQPWPPWRAVRNPNPGSMPRSSRQCWAMMQA